MAPDEPTMGFLATGLDLQGPSRDALALTRVGEGALEAAQQRGQRELTQSAALCSEPLAERVVLGNETFEEFSLIERQNFASALGVRRRKPEADDIDRDAICRDPQPRGT